MHKLPSLHGVPLPDFGGHHPDPNLVHAKHLLDLINDVLDLSKIEAGRFVIAPSDCDVQRVLRQQLDLWTPLAEEKGLEISLAIDIDLERY